MTRHGKPTIVDVAAAANVSVATVSYVLSGKRPIGRETQERVREAIAALSYRPNPNAQALRASKYHLLSVLISDWRESILLLMMQGIESAARERGYHLTVSSLEEFDNDTASAVEHLARKAIDGVLFVSGIAHDEPLLFPSVEVPIVGVNRPVGDNAPAILCDNVDGGYRAARHLLEQGSTRPAVIAGPISRAANRNRLAGFRRALADEGIELPDGLVFPGNFEASGGEAGLATLLAEDASIDGIFCTNDAMAAGALSRAIRDGVDVPGRVRIAGFDNEKFASLLPITLTSFSLPGDEMARTGAETLMDLVDGAEPLFTRLMIRSTLHCRQSTAF